MYDKVLKVLKGLLIVAGVFLAIVIVLLIIGSFKPQSGDKTGASSTEESKEVADPALDPDVDYSTLYGEQKAYADTISSMRNRVGDENLPFETVSYMFELAKNGDYENAYTYVATDAIAACGIDYDLVDFQEDMEYIFRYYDNSNIQELELGIMQQYTYTDYGKRYIYSISNGSETGDNLYVNSMYFTEDAKIIPFDIALDASYRAKYGATKDFTSAQQAQQPIADDAVPGDDSATTSETTEDGDTPQEPVGGIEGTIE